MSNSKLFADLAAAELSLCRWGACLRNTRKFQPIMRAEWDRAFDKREALKAQALYADPIRYAIAYPGNAYGIRHLLPADMAARIEAAETDAEIEAALRTPADGAACDAAIAAIESALDVEAPAMVPQVAQLQQANAGRAAVSPEHRDTADAFHSTDAAWQNALTAQFGRKASEIRYTAAGAGEPGSELRRLYSERYRAYAAWAELRGMAVMLDPLCEPALVMVPQPCQQPQARARGPARGERRYVEVRDTETGEMHRVLTSVATVGVAVVIFTPSNRHREGALSGMLITHDDIRKAWVFNDGLSGFKC